MKYVKSKLGHINYQLKWHRFSSFFLKKLNDVIRHSCDEMLAAKPHDTIFRAERAKWDGWMVG